MRKLFYPDSVVVIGVSNSPSNLARNIVSNLDSFSYQGQISLIGKEGGKLGSRVIYDNLGKIPVTPELAVILTPAGTIPGLLEACGKAGIHRVILESGGFSEFSEDAVGVEKALLQLAAKYGIRFVGPNCVGLMNFDNGLVLPFAPIDPSSMRTGGVSFLVQSGGISMIAAKILGHENVGVNKIVSMGNKLNLTENDYLRYLVKDKETSVIGLYLESVADGRQLMKIAGSTTKPIIVLKANTGMESHDISRFHTSAIAGDDTVCSAAFAQAGMHRVYSISDLIDHAKIFLLPPMAGPNLVVVGRSGGFGVLAADAVRKYGFSLPEIPPALKLSIHKHVRAGVIRLTNPLDLGDLFNEEFYISIVETVLAEEQVHGVLLMQTYSSLVGMEDVARPIQAVARLSERYGKPVVVCFIADRSLYYQIKSTSTCPLFFEPDSALRALSASCQHATSRKKPLEGKAIRKRTKAKASITTPPHAALSRLLSIGIPVVPFEVVNDRSEAVRAAARLGYPVVLKISSSEIVHKTDSRGVTTGIDDEQSLRKCLEEMEIRFRSILTDAHNLSFMVQKMIPGGVETILGTKHDSEFGPTVIFGLGGTLTEILGDVAVRVAPVKEREAAEMIRQIKGYPLLQGFRGQGQGDLGSLAGLISKFSKVLLDFDHIEEFEINPLVVLAKGKGCAAVDARLRARPHE